MEDVRYTMNVVFCEGSVGIAKNVECAGKYQILWVHCIPEKTCQLATDHHKLHQQLTTLLESNLKAPDGSAIILDEHRDVYLPSSKDIQ